MMNPYSGGMPLDVHGQEFTLAFTWEAIARMRAELGADGQARALAGDPEKLAQLVAIGLARHHQDVTQEMVCDASPPLLPTIKAVSDALNAAYYGPSGAPKKNDRGKAANPPQPPQTPLKRLWRRLLGRG